MNRLEKGDLVQFMYTDWRGVITDVKYHPKKGTKYIVKWGNINNRWGITQIESCYAFQLVRVLPKQPILNTLHIWIERLKKQFSKLF